MSDSLVSRLLAEAEAHPDRDAIVDERGKATYGELACRILGAASRLHALGVRAGDTVALSFGESREQVVEFVSVLYGAGYLGAALLPLYPDVPQARRAELVAAFGARWSVAAEREDLGATGLLLSEVCDKLHTSMEAPPRADLPEHPFYYQFSSGTTGVPKVILFSHRQLCANSLATLADYGLGVGDRVLPAVRAPAKMGLRYLVRALAGGGALVNVQFPATRQELGLVIRSFDITAVTASPWQLRRLLQTAPDFDATTRRLRALICIGAMVTAEDVSTFRRELAPNLYVSYSSTESGGIAVLGPRDAAGGGYAKLPEADIQVVGEDGLPLAAGETGAIRVRVPWMPMAYVDNPQASAQRFRDGWFYPGDAGSLDAEGRLFVRGRGDSTINYGGVKLIPEEVEAVLIRHPGVSDAIVTSVPDAMAGEIPVAFVVLSPPATLQALKLFCEAHLDANLIPAAILSVEKMPRSADGKVARAQLREHARSLAHMFHSTKP
jgi:long-chain acyl-CoA synthetase